MTKAKKGGLGKGLDALFMDNETADSGIVTLRLSEIEPNKDQPRKSFNEDSLIGLRNMECFSRCWCVRFQQEAISWLQVNAAGEPAEWQDCAKFRL